jgi:hypothetical protein
MRPFRPLFVAFAALCAVTSSAQAAPRAVVELFTSPNCSSCPPADRLFVKLAHNPDLITLVMPVDIWNRPSRKDELAVRAFTERQMGYADVRNEDTLYTPQAMINGAEQANGADAEEIGNAVAHTSGALFVDVTAAVAGSEIVVSIGAAEGEAARGMITVLPFVSSRTIKAYGQRITYANLVRDIVPLGSWKGEALQRTIPLADYTQYDGIVVLVQAGSPLLPGAIIGAARIALSAPKA